MRGDRGGGACGTRSREVCGKTGRKRRDYFKGLGVDGRTILGRIRGMRLRIRKNSRLLQIWYRIVVFRTLQRISGLLKALLASEEFLSAQDRHCSLMSGRHVHSSETVILLFFFTTRFCDSHRPALA
jgi:hypothetical protein